MSKRNAKKRLENNIVDAIDQLIISQSLDEKTLEEKTDLLIDIFDAAVTGINGERKVKGRSNKKKHFRDLFADTDKKVKAVLQSK